jgi:hydroxymethylglutaryl-CoA synthase
MPISAMSFLYMRGLARSDHHQEEFEEICVAAEVSPDEVRKETESEPDLYKRVLDGQAEIDPYPATGKAAGVLRRRPQFIELLEKKMGLGGEIVRDLGNLYSAALPAWIAAGFEQAVRDDIELTGASMVMVGYGSGDAAEAIPMSAVAGFREAASRIKFKEALERARDLTRDEYEALHDGTEFEDEAFQPSDEFAIQRVGVTYEATFQDLGVEYYEYVAPR